MHTSYTLDFRGPHSRRAVQPRLGSRFEPSASRQRVRRAYAAKNASCRPKSTIATRRARGTRLQINHPRCRFSIHTRSQLSSTTVSRRCIRARRARETAQPSRLCRVTPPVARRQQARDAAPGGPPAFPCSLSRDVPGHHALTDRRDLAAAPPALRAKAALPEALRLPTPECRPPKTRAAFPSRPCARRAPSSCRRSDRTRRAAPGA
jgi:hypothetical protein